MSQNRYELLSGGCAAVYIRGGGAERATLIDAADLPAVLSMGLWYAQRRNWTWYAACTTSRSGQRVTVRLHRFLMRPPADMEVDHIDHDGLNNTRANLQVVTPDENKENIRPGGGRDIGRRWYEAGCTCEPLPF